MAADGWQLVACPGREDLHEHHDYKNAGSRCYRGSTTRRHASTRRTTPSPTCPSFILESSEGLLREGGLGAVFAVLTIFLFLFSLRSTFVAAVSIPLSILTALVVMQVAGITLNILTLGGLAVAVGRVVDDAIVVLENIYRHRALGEDRLTAVINGPREVAGAITASTLTTVAVFLPLGFVGGFVSQFFLPFALTVTFALLASLIVALTVVPVLAYLLIGRVKLNVDETGEPKNSFWVRIYDPAIRFVLRNRWTKVGTSQSRASCSSPRSPSRRSCRPSSSTPARRRSSRSSPWRRRPGAGSDAGPRATPTEAEAILLADPDVELVQTSVPGEGDVGFQALLAAQQGRATNSAQIVVRLDQAVDLDGEPKILSRRARPGQDRTATTSRWRRRPATQTA